MTGGNGSGVEFAVGCGEGDGASDEHPGVEHGFNVQGGGSGIGDRAGGGVGGHSFVESSFQACYGEGFAVGEGDEIDDGAEPEHSTDVEDSGAVGGRTGGAVRDVRTAENERWVSVRTGVVEDIVIVKHRGEAIGGVNIFKRCDGG